MKKLYLILILLLLFLVGCSSVSSDRETFPIGNSEGLTEETPDETKLIINETSPVAPAIDSNTDPWRENADIFGTPVFCTVEDEAGTATYSVNVPDYSFQTDHNGCLYMRSEKGQILFLGSPDAAYPEVADLDNLFEQWEPYILSDFAQHRMSRLTDYDLTIEDCEQIQIDQKEFLRIRGSITYQDDNDIEELVIIGYAGQLNNGAYAYWFCAAAKGSNYLDLKTIADNMARSFSEVTF